MKLKMAFAILAIVSVVILTVAIMAPTLATIPQNSPTVTTYGSHGEVILQLPTAIPSRPTCLRLVASNYTSETTFGARNGLLVYLWIPVYNGFVPVAAITDGSSDVINFLHEFWNGTAVWNPPNMNNVINVTDKVLEVWRAGDVIIANLTMPQRIVLPFDQMNGSALQPAGNQTFILPALTLTFHPIGEDFEFTESFTIPKPQFSGYNMTIKSFQSPAWVQVEIPAWLRNAQLEVTGHICNNLVEEYIPPAA